MKKLPSLLLLTLLTACNNGTTSISNSTGTSNNGTTSISGSGSTSNNDSKTSTSTGEIGKEKYWDVSNTDISHIDKDNRLICFTFDDGPISNTANQLLDVFDNFNKNYASEGFEAHGTFFYKGINVVEANKSTIERAIKSKFQIGNHTLNHKHLEDLPAREIKAEVNGTITNLNKFVDVNEALVRLPFGTYNDLVLDTINYPLINWTNGLDTLDWSGKSADEIYNTVINNLCEGGIVLMHEGYQTTINAVKKLLPALYERGYQVVTINEYCKARDIKLERHKVYTYLGDL